MDKNNIFYGVVALFILIIILFSCRTNESFTSIITQSGSARITNEKLANRLWIMDIVSSANGEALGFPTKIYITMSGLNYYVLFYAGGKLVKVSKIREIEELQTVNGAGQEKFIVNLKENDFGSRGIDSNFYITVEPFSEEKVNQKDSAIGRASAGDQVSLFFTKRTYPTAYIKARLY